MEEVRISAIGSQFLEFILTDLLSLFYSSSPCIYLNALDKIISHFRHSTERKEGSI